MVSVVPLSDAERALLTRLVRLPAWAWNPQEGNADVIRGLLACGLVVPAPPFIGCYRAAPDAAERAGIEREPRQEKML
jgi:hypothetical protein